MPANSQATRGVPVPPAPPTHIAVHPRPVKLDDLTFEERKPVLPLPGLDVAEVNAPLRLKMANEMAWSNRLTQAIAQYETLMADPAQADSARLPLANAYRWTGRPHLALPLYQDAVRQAPSNVDASDGLEYAERELRPRTTLGLNTSKDSGDLSNHGATLSHRWRDSSLKQIFELETDWRNSLQHPIGPQARHNGASFRYQNLGWALSPDMWLSAQTKPRNGWFGGLRVKVGDLPVHAELARENFGLTSFSARALDAGLTANRVGLEGSWGDTVGVLSGRVNWYNISDTNTLRTGSLKFAPSWRPLGLWFKPYASIDTRDVKFNTPNYWSPADGSGTLGLGATAEWASKDWYFVMAGQLGTRMYGEAGSSWSASVGAQRWLNRDTALTVNLWGMSSIRDQVRYKANTLSVKLDRLW